MSDPLERTATAHESVSALLHAIDPRVLIRIACLAAGIEIGEIVRLRYRNPRTEVAASSKRALGLIVDLVVTVAGADKRVTSVWVIEAELSYTVEKIWIWALYEATVEAEYRATGRVVVFCPEPKLRRRIRTNLLPKMKTKPILIEPDQIERICDYEEAVRRPELTILGCLFHAQAPAPMEQRVEVFRAAWVALQSLEKLVAQRYHVAIMRTVASEVVDQGLAELRESGELVEGRWELFSDSEREGWSFQTGHREGLEQGLEQGLERGRKQGLEQGRRQACELLSGALVDMLEVRGFALTPPQRERIESCDSLELLQRWYAAAKTTSSVDELLS
jgi:hypothetical protein